MPSSREVLYEDASPPVKLLGERPMSTPTISDKVLALVRRHPGLTEIQLAEKLYGRQGYQQQVNAACRYLVNERLVKREGIGGAIDPYRYYVIDNDHKTETQEFYHCCSTQLEPGSIILPGNWGRIINHPRRIHDWIWWREGFFEMVRRYDFPNKPSRLLCAFVCDDLNTMIGYRNSQAPFSVIYKVKLIDTSLLAHRTNYEFLDQNYGQDLDVQDWHNIAQLYWGDCPKDLSTAEILVKSRLRIVKKLNN